VVRLKESGHAILWVVETNPLSVIRRVERVYLMEGGTVRGEYDAKSVLEDPNFIAIFMGTQATTPEKTSTAQGGA
jgi:ABC-type branched-subunit amino acid transport system ATPase component